MPDDAINLDSPEPAPPESFETARPVVSPDSPEQHVIGACLLDDGITLDAAISAQLAATDFTDRACATIYGRLVKMRHAGTPIGLDTLTQELGKRELVQVGGIPHLIELTDPSRVPTTARAAYFIQRVLDDSARRRFAQVSRELAERADRGEDIQALRDSAVTLGPQRKDTAAVTPARPITSYAYPEDNDPNTLLGNDDYLGRGGGMLFVSHAGAGKSSWIMDACMMWALGRPWMGIKCNGALKSLIIQAEDSDRYIGKIFTSFAHVNRLTTDEIDQLSKNCIIVRRKGFTGAAFERELTELTTAHQPDLVALNPIYLFAEGDIGRSEYAQPFLVGLDRVNRAEKWGYILIHHTGKPIRAANGKRPDVEDWESAYMGFGSSYFANWPRCSALLEPLPNQPGRFQIKLGKGGFNAGVTQKVEHGMGHRLEPATRIAIRHSTDRMEVNGRDKPVYYWELDDEPTETESGAQEATGGPKRGRPEVYPFSTYRSIFPAKKDTPLKLGELTRRAIQNKPITEKQLYNVLERYAASGLIECVEVQGEPKKYRLAV